MSRLSTLFVFLLLLLSACGQPQVQNATGAQPSWVLNPSSGSHRGAVGVAGRTYDQSISSQRKLAIQRALDELALQTKVEVVLNMSKEEQVTNNSSYVNTKDNSTYRAKGKISAHIEDVWMDKSTHELYVWMVLDN